MGAVKKVGLEFLGIEANKDTGKMENCSSITFPKLKQLKFSKLHCWEEWEYCTLEDHTCVMPSLVSLRIEDCRCLRATFPNFLLRTPLQHLTINECPHLKRFCQEGTGTQELLKILTSTDCNS
ncbi:hypothetical protein TIFTF001_028847 [Ficus carica]|uniref:Uncharacterized protein n=1 Tax=Ficus carica TaxID=3494 RepID=A0AA88DQG7_FICCA|nr:hypothetical protein TIFTF001_028847 [Ficus carica]